MDVVPLKKRADFLALQRAPAVSTAAFRLVRARRVNQSRLDTTHELADDNYIRVGFTVTKKIGNAVTRNRIRRRLKSVVHLVFPLQGEPHADYVVIAYKNAFDRSFHDLIADMEKAVLALKAGKGKKRR